MRLLDAMHPQAYGIFLLHYIFVIWLQYAVYDYAWPAFAKFAIVLGRHARAKLGGHGAAAKNSVRGANDLRVRKCRLAVRREQE